jgi:superfamily II DNA or RNA helicase
VWLWDEWPGRWAADAGIDLVAETMTGSLWAIQAKAYDAAYAIKKVDVDSFLSESSRAQFSFRLLLATTDRIGPTARRTLAGQEKPAGLLLRSQLAIAEVVWPSSPDDLRPRRETRKRPLPHQEQAVAAVARGFEMTDRGQLVMACGTGKTLTACFLTERLSARRVLVLVPSLSLLAQTLREWGHAATFEYLAVCSDETVAVDDADAVVASTSELGFPVTTDSTVIARFLRGKGRWMRVVFATYQSSPRVADAQKTRTPPFDLVIADEAHRCAGPEGSVFATVLDPAKIKGSKRLFMTATPRFFTGRVRREAGEADWELASMDDERVFGPVFHSLSFAQAIEQGLLSDYEVVVVGVTDATYREYAERGVFVTADGEVVSDARTLASQLGLLRAMANHDLHRVVTFHSRIRTAAAFARSLPEVCAWLPPDRRPEGALWADHVSGEMTSGERDNRLNRLRAVEATARGVLTNARCLAEGVDVPTLDGVAFIEPRRSQVDVVQAVGRAIRRAEDKTLGTVVIPVFVDTDADAELALESGEFQRVWDVVKALRVHDEVLADELDDLRRELGRRTRSVGRPRKLHFDVPVGIGIAFARAFDTRLVEMTTSNWEFWCGLFQRFVDREQHGRVLATHIEDGYRLGSWVTAQRHLHAKGRLSVERATRLEALQGWDWDPFATTWEEGFSQLERFVADNGHAAVPKSYLLDGYRLGSWAHVQRQRRKRGQLSDDRVARLTAQRGWLWDINDARWEQGFTFLQQYAAHEHHTRVPQGHLEGGFKLGQWVNVQRLFHRNGRLPADRTARLAAQPGWVWDAPGSAWERHYAALESFVSRERHARVPSSHVEGDLKLGQWVVVQRSFRIQGRLADDRAARLEDLPGWAWNANDAVWEDGFSHLKSFVAREGHARVPFDTVEDDGYRLGRWVVKQRSRRDQLRPVRTARLEALPGWEWNRKESGWETGFLRLETFVAREGHARVSQDHVEEGYRLGHWVSKQRQAVGRGRLSEDRQARLAALPGWVWAVSKSRPAPPAAS